MTKTNTNEDVIRALLRQTTAAQIQGLTDAGEPRIAKKDLRAFAVVLAESAEGEGAQAMLTALNAVGERVNAALDDVEAENAMSPAERAQAAEAFEVKRAETLARLGARGEETEAAMEGLRGLLASRGAAIGKAASLRMSVESLDETIAVFVAEREVVAAELAALESALAKTAAAKETLAKLARTRDSLFASCEAGETQPNPFAGAISAPELPIPLPVMGLFRDHLMRLVAEGGDQG